MSGSACHARPDADGTPTPGTPRRPGRGAGEGGGEGGDEGGDEGGEIRVPSGQGCDED